jgi:hypothetical protein
VYSSNNGGNNGGNNTPYKGKMTGPRETIGSNTPTKSRNDQVSPRSRGGMVQQTPNDGSEKYDPKNNPRGAMVGDGSSKDPKDAGRNTNDNGKEVSGAPTKGNTGRGNTPDNKSNENTYTPEKGTVSTDNGGEKTKPRVIDRTTPDYKGGETPSRGSETPKEYERPQRRNEKPVAEVMNPQKVEHDLMNRVILRIELMSSLKRRRKPELAVMTHLLKEEVTNSQPKIIIKEGKNLETHRHLGHTTAVEIEAAVEMAAVVPQPQAAEIQEVQAVHLQQEEEVDKSIHYNKI